MSERDRKLVVLGIPWDVDTEGLREYMSKYGELEDVIVMRDRATGRSRGFGYATFALVEDAKKVLAADHALHGRTLEVKVATPKEEMKAPSKKITRIFVARIPSSVTEDAFQKYFEEYGKIEDLYMPKEEGSRRHHRGIGFITFESSESVDRIMSETHKLGGATIAVDRAMPKEESTKNWEKPVMGGYGAYNAYISAATRYRALGSTTLYDQPSSRFIDDYGSSYGSANSWPPHLAGSSFGMDDRHAGYGSGTYSGPPRLMGRKIFVGRLPQDATAEDLRQYFRNFGSVVDVYVPKDPRRSGHRGFGFVTFAEEGVADRVSRRSHEILGQQVAIDSATPPDDDAIPPGGISAPLRGTTSYPGGVYDWGYDGSGIGPGPTGSRHTRMDYRYRPY
uniref:RRM domain-containing protein n=1 Tax=Araucaria cunninghamii TaxID=56994 RepID=A0A0D6R6Q5_ARACU